MEHESAELRTSWTTIRQAAAGHSDSRQSFAALYQPVIRAYLQVRWNTGRLASQVEDAIQDVFVECFRSEGILERVDPDQTPSFRGFLYGVVRNVARRYESRLPLQSLEAPVPADETSLSGAFDRAYAVAVMQEATRVQAANAEWKGAAAQRRVELLKKRFGEGLPIREIAALWQVDPAWLHHQYATARDEFHEALRSVVRDHQPGLNGAPLEERCRELMQLLQGRAN